MSGLSWPLLGLVSAFVALALWVSGLSSSALDGWVAATLAFGVAVSSVGYLTARPVGTRRLSVVALGANGFGLLVLFLLVSLK